MGKIARGLISFTYLFISLPFGIIFLLMLFTIFKNLNTTGYVYVRGMFDFIFIYIFLNFVLSLLIGTLLVFVRNAGPRLIKTVTCLTFVLLLHDLPPIVTLVEDMTAGIRIGIPWPVLLMSIHAILFIALVRIWLSFRTANV